MFQSFDPKITIGTPYLFFTGKGGVGKTSTACATAVYLADDGKKVLLVSTDPASNLQDVLKVELSNLPQEVPAVPNLHACNLDPEEAARTYREKVVGPYRGVLPESVVTTMEEQMSGACTVEIAAFDEFTSLLADPKVTGSYDHIIFDTAPTGHTLRLLQLPTAWTHFLEESTHGASCLGPLSGLGDKKDLYQKTMEALSDSKQTMLMLVARPDESSLIEANRAAGELREIGIENQTLIVNGLMKDYVPDDEVSSFFYTKQQLAIRTLPAQLKQGKIYSLPYVSYSLTGTESLRTLLKGVSLPSAESVSYIRNSQERLPELKDLIDELSHQNKRVIFTMGKGGVGKTSIASAIAVGLVEKGHNVLLTTTDPAAHVAHIFKDHHISESLTISQIDPKQEVMNYKEEVLANAGKDLDEDGIAYLEEDLNSPCTEEIAVFRAFADVVDQSENQIVVIDTAPTGHTLLLLDAAQSYHKELSRSTGEVPDRVKKLLPRLRNPNETSVVIVTLAEATPVLEASRLQDDLKRANIHPSWWVINQSLYATQTKDPVLMGRAISEVEWIQEVESLSEKCAIVPIINEEKLGYLQIKNFLTK
ncbi:arsenical pump-driving ATPase [Cytobacillus spongiae]|uniref:arsenical pump-driving ATPase n=1 Tax=Cytobacillus spongiae TaxID=2901381 RepID=UPI001F205C9C|nr:arsenical pump-driving ATPase [Cytobacillus spongiae]UII57806.1 arsenical pump-driving ATPase [Cytobacillus spongiae]